MSRKSKARRRERKKQEWQQMRDEAKRQTSGRTVRIGMTAELIEEHSTSRSSAIFAESDQN